MSRIPAWTLAEAHVVPVCSFHDRHCQKPSERTGALESWSMGLIHLLQEKPGAQGLVKGSLEFLALLAH